MSTITVKIKNETKKVTLFIAPKNKRTEKLSFEFAAKALANKFSRIGKFSIVRIEG